MTSGSGSGSMRGGRVIVGLRAKVDAQGLHRCADELAGLVPGTRVIRVSPSGRVVLELTDDVDPDAVAAELNRLPEVRYAERDVVERVQPGSTLRPQARG